MYAILIELNNFPLNFQNIGLVSEEPTKGRDKGIHTNYLEERI